MGALRSSTQRWRFAFEAYLVPYSLCVLLAMAYKDASFAELLTRVPKVFAAPTNNSTKESCKGAGLSHDYMSAFDHSIAVKVSVLHSTAGHDALGDRNLHSVAILSSL